MDLGLRRLLLVVLSIIGGVALVYPMLFLIGVATGHPDTVTAESYGSIYFILSAAPLALLVGIWLDYFMRTGIIPETNDGPAAAPAKKGGRSAAAPTAAGPTEE